MLQSMSDWLHALPLAWMAAVVFGVTYLVAAVIYGAVRILATGKRARSFKAVSPGLLSPLGVLLGLFVAFTAVQVWGDNERAENAVIREASLRLRWFRVTTALLRRLRWEFLQRA